MLRYLQTCVREVIKRHRTWVLQHLIQRHITDAFLLASSPGAPKVSRSRDEILKGISEERNYWENISAAHRGTNKMVPPPLPKKVRPSRPDELPPATLRP